MAISIFVLSRRLGGSRLAVLLLLCLVFSGAISGAQQPAKKTRPQGGQDAARRQLVAGLRAHIHHVFVIYQENRSFDAYFGSFPGVDNLATVEARAHGFRQYDAIGKTWVTPFLLTNAPDSRDADHSRKALIAKSDGGRMDHFVSFEETKLVNSSGYSPQAARQLGILTMAHEDCSTIPYLWMYAHRFTIYDHIFQAMYGPSTPGNIDLIAGQSGQTQAARHPDQASQFDSGPGEPVVNDPNPDFGPYATARQQTGVHQLDQTYATLMLTMKGKDAPEDVKKYTDDVKEDVGALGQRDHQAIPWAWYQEGFGDGKGNNHPAYIPHHNAPQYFGYIRQNPAMWSGEHDLLDFFADIENQQLPARSVVFIKGGRLNPFGWKPANPSALTILGDDDHPGYADSQLSESLVAKVINAIARGPYWKDSAIIILWDDSEGFYDHVPPPRFEMCPDKEPCGDGPRVPLLLISPYAKSSGVVSDPGDHVSFAKFLDVLFDLPPMASLPDEKPYLPQGPRDMNPRLTDLLGGFDPARLAGRKAPIAASQAEIPDAEINTFPPKMTCKDIGVAPVPIPGTPDTPPTGWKNSLP